MTAFNVPWGNPDLDIHPSPEPGWDRVACVGLWTDAKKLRKDWPHAAVVGPLRTLRGIDLLVRSLLANPQIRVLVVTGRDLSPGQSVHADLLDLFNAASGGTARFDAVVSQHLPVLTQELRALPDEVRATAMNLWGDPNDGEGFIFVHDGDAAKWGEGTEEGGPESPQRYALRMAPSKDRPGGAIFLTPPPPPENPELPAGLPGQRVTGRTLAGVWPRVLQEVLRFGDAVGASYGGSRELLNLVSVIEDPAGSLEEIKKLPFTGWGPTVQSDTVEDFLEGKFHVEPASPNRAKHPVLGISWADLDDYYTKSFMGKVPPEGVSYSYGSRLHGGPYYGMAHDEYGVPYPVNQPNVIRQLLQSTPGTRAAFLTPWRPDEDCGKESGRPCMVGAWFRAVEADSVVLTKRSAREVVLAEEYVPQPGDRIMTTFQYPSHKLHLAVQFRSHDLHGAYPLNLAACCLWLCEEAKALGMEVGTVTCLSMSAHVYDRDLEAAAGVVSKHVKATWSQDARSAWRVWKKDTTLEGAASFYAEATDPAGTRVLQAFEAPTQERLIRDIQASGLVTSVQHALWLGAEVGKL